jgi:glucose/arabinose dehydrogenase
MRVSASFLPGLASAAVPFTLQGPGVNPADFRVTVFASGLSYPLGMARLPDGSMLVSVLQNASFFGGTASLVRLVDANGDGVADAAPVVLYTGLSMGQSSLKIAGNLVFVTGQKTPITVLRLGATPASALTLVGTITVTYPSGGWLHPHSALAVRKTQGSANRYDLLFQLGSDTNFAVTTRTATLGNIAISGATGTLAGESIYLLNITDQTGSVTASGLTRVASGLRNAAGMAFHPVTGDLYFQENGIDGLVDANEPLSADELNVIPRNSLGSAGWFFGFPANYTAYRTGIRVGGAGVQPLIAFQPLPNPQTGAESEGANDIAHAPPGFPDGLNTGIFVGFHGKFGLGGVQNEENPLVYVNPATGSYFHFIAGKQAGIGHLDGLLSTRDSLFVADLSTTGSLGSGLGGGVIYQIKSNVTPRAPSIEVKPAAAGVELRWDRGSLQEALDPAGPWAPLPDAFSPATFPLDQPRKFFRAGY